MFDILENYWKISSLFKNLKKSLVFIYIKLELLSVSWV